MSTGVDREILGDWNNLKGTRYHLAYAIWLILRGRAAEVRFFEGNDLLAAPIVPPTVAAGGPAPTVSVGAQTAAEDVWIQLKCTRSPWTPSALLDENLLLNFVCNSFTSQQRGRPWQVRLVTEAEVRKDEILEFVGDPAGKPTLLKKLDGIVAQFGTALAGWGTGAPSAADIKARALDVLRMLAGTEPVMLDTLKAEVEVEIALASPDRNQVQRLASLLVGAMLEDSGAGPASARPYDAAWVNEVVGFGIRSDKPFDLEVVRACDLAAATVALHRLYPPFDAARHVRRGGLVRALERFAAAPETVFLLTGASGRGTSWSLADWATQALAGRVRVMLFGADVPPGPTAERLIAEPLARYSDRAWIDDHVLGRLLAAARAPGKGPLVVLLDDLRPDELDARGESRVLTRLVERLRAAGGKLIVSCEEQLWKLHRPWRHIPAGALYDPEGASAGQPTNRSYALPEFDPDELAGAVRRGLTQGAVTSGLAPDRVLLGPGYLPLRNASLLARYLQTHARLLGEGGAPPPPVNVDRLLAESIAAQLERAATTLLADHATVRAAFDSLVDRLWTRRRAGVGHAEAVEVLQGHFPGQGHTTLDALRRSGLLATESPLRILDGHVADHLFALRLERQLAADPAGVTGLDPDRDGTTVEALIRASPHFSDRAEALLTQDVRWRGPVTRGLAQREPGLRAFAMAATLSRPRGNLLADHDGCLALGILAARDDDTFDRVERMYLGPDEADALRGAESLAIALEYAPDRVCELVRRRWAREVANTDFSERRSRGTRLRDALLPLSQVNHRAAAVAVRGTLDALVGGIDLKSIPHADQLTELIDFIHGRLIPFEGDGAPATLMAELESSDGPTRFRAAGVLRSVGHVLPGPVIEPICAAIRREGEPEILARLLRGTYAVLEFAPAAVLGAVEARRDAILAQPVSAAPALALLGHAAHFDPVAVHRLLPLRLAQFEAWARACLADVLAFAWWRVADLRPEAVPVLEALSVPDLDGVTQEFRAFSERGAAVARLGRLCLGTADPRSTMVSMTREIPGSLPYYYTNTTNLFLSHATAISADGRSAALAEHLVRVVRAASGLPDRPDLDPLRTAQFFAARNSLDELLELSSRHADPVALLRDLPRDWEALYAARRLLQAGVRSEALLAFARDACAEHERGGSMTAIHERDLCLSEIALATGDPGGAVAAHFSGRPPSLFGSASDAQAHGIASYIDAHPDQLLSHLDAAVRDVEAVVALFHWRGLARHWRAYLIAEMFHRMFDHSPIDPTEAARLVCQMREAIRNLPPSPMRDEYERGYAAIDSWLSGTPVALTGTAPADTPIGRSHLAVAHLFDSALAARAGGEGSAWLDDFLWQGECWWQSTRYRVEAGRISSALGEGAYLITMLPALRLALVAVGQQVGRPDPAGQFMRERQDALGRADAARRVADASDPTGLEARLQNLEGADPSVVRDERVLGTAGFFLLLLGRLSDAEERLRRALASPLIDRAHRADSLYHLACVLARTGREQECREALEGAVQLEPGYRAGLLQDGDFAFVRERDWFMALVPQPATQPPDPAQPESFQFASPPVQVQAGDLPDRFEGWELRYLIHGPYDQACPGWARSVAAALRAQFPGATVTVEAVAGMSASATVTAPEGTPEQQVARAREVARSVEELVARRAVCGPG
jgi:hypothetical protein